jgi:FHS family L-fucose permease-like MFS transporter
MEISNPGRSLATIVLVFFFWGFVAASNTVLIGLFKDGFELSQFQSQLVDWAFYAAYFSGSLIYFLLSVFWRDPLHVLGYKKGLILGLTVSAIGSLGFIPAADAQSYALMLTSLFVVGLGFSLQQIVANPYVIALGEPKTGAHRVSLAGGINSFGTAIGPLLVSYAIFGNITGENKFDLGIESVKTPYLYLAGAFILVAIILALSKLPKITSTEKIEKGIGALKFPQLRWGMLAIFVYVGVEVAIQSNLPELMKQPDMLGLTSDHTVHFISLYWGSLMIGRWTGAIAAFKLNAKTRKLLITGVPLIAFLVLLGVNWIKFSAIGELDKMNELYNYIPFIVIMIVATYLGQEKPAKTLIIYGSIALLMMIGGLLSEGITAIYFFISGGLFCSIMWPCIFSLSLAGLGKYTNQGSAFLIMMILGGAIIPPLQGAIADLTSIHLSYWLAVICFAFIVLYGIRVKQILVKQGVNYDE